MHQCAVTKKRPPAYHLSNAVLKLTNLSSASDKVLHWLPGIVLFTVPLPSHEPLPGAARPSHRRDLFRGVQSLVGLLEWCLRRAVRPRPLLLLWLFGLCTGVCLVLLLKDDDVCYYLLNLTFYKIGAKHAHYPEPSQYIDIA